ncbi:hypothetical protein SDJN03_23728, partial [Cucurbita argyrosperma subsp. sororia]
MLNFDSFFSSFYLHSKTGDSTLPNFNKMNKMVVQHNAFSVHDDMLNASAVDERLVCPKPRRLGSINVRPFQSDALELLFLKGGCGLESFNSSGTELASSPPFFCGSPPTRVANPLIQDDRFGDEKPKVFPLFSSAPPSPSSPPPSTGRTGGCVRVNFGNNPAVRIEGFECRLDRERRNRSVAALA